LQLYLPLRASERSTKYISYANERSTKYIAAAMKFAARMSAWGKYNIIFRKENIITK